MNWMELAIPVSHSATEAVAEVFTGFGSGGVVIEDPRLLNYYINSGLWDYTDLKEVEDKGFSVVKAYFHLSEKTSYLLEEIQEELDKIKEYDNSVFIGKLIKTSVKEDDWENSWKKYFHPTRIGEKIVIVPTWEHYEESPNDIIIKIDPGMAFGTGSHITTSLCIEQMEKLDLQGKVLFDIGTGSGILSLVAAKLGAEKIVSVDFDPLAIKFARENIKINNVEDKVTLKEGNLFTNVEGQADVIVANIVADVINELLVNIKEKLKTGGAFIASGIIVERALEICRNAEKAGLGIEKVLEKNNWVLIVMRKVN